MERDGARRGKEWKEREAPGQDEPGVYECGPRRGRDGAGRGKYDKCRRRITPPCSSALRDDPLFPNFLIKARLGGPLTASMTRCGRDKTQNSRIKKGKKYTWEPRDGGGKGGCLGA